MKTYSSGYSRRLLSISFSSLCLLNNKCKGASNTFCSPQASTGLLLQQLSSLYDAFSHQQSHCPNQQHHCTRYFGAIKADSVFFSITCNPERSLHSLWEAKGKKKIRIKKANYLPNLWVLFCVFFVVVCFTLGFPLCCHSTTPQQTHDNRL